MKEYRITTIDNPYDPFTEFTLWYQFDVAMGYNSSAYLDRVLTTSEEFSDLDQSIDIEIAIDTIVDGDPSGIFKKVTRERN